MKEGVIKIGYLALGAALGVALVLIFAHLLPAVGFADDIVLLAQIASALVAMSIAVSLIVSQLTSNERQ
jgi:uncharacterized membrane protein YkvA (DUF1232 family)